MFLESLKSKSNINKHSPYLDVSILQNYLIFFMTVTINLKEETEYVYTIFNKKHNYFKKIFQCIQMSHTLHLKTKFWFVYMEE